jgi:hypothetical protein
VLLTRVSSFYMKGSAPVIYFFKKKKTDAVKLLLLKKNRCREALAVRSRPALVIDRCLVDVTRGRDEREGVSRGHTKRVSRVVCGFSL